MPKIFPPKKSPGPNTSLVNFTKHWKKAMSPFSFPGKKKWSTPQFIYEAHMTLVTKSKTGQERKKTDASISHTNVKKS